MTFFAIIIFLVSIFFMPLTAHAAQDKIDLNDWAALPVMHDGRVKPIDSFARIMRKTLSGSERGDGVSPADWLAETAFNPAEAVEKPVILYRDGHAKAELLT